MIDLPVNKIKFCIEMVIISCAFNIIDLCVSTTADYLLVQKLHESWSPLQLKELTELRLPFAICRVTQ